ILDSFTQAEILDATVNHPLVQRYPPSSKYKHSFLKHLVSAVEAQSANDPTELYSDRGVCIDNLLDEYLSFVIPKGIPDNRDSFRSYFLPFREKYVTLKESEETISFGTTGLRTWPAALMLISFLQLLDKKNSSEPRKVTNTLLPMSLKNSRIIELGCGAGLVGICSSILGASHVVFTDTNHTVLEAVRKNCEINNISVANDSELLQTATKQFFGSQFASILSLDWETTADSKLALLVSSLNADFIVASDVAYDPIIVPPFVRVLSAFLTFKDHAKAFVATTRRTQSTWELFLKELDGRELTWEKLQVNDESLINTYYFDEGGDIDILCIWKRQ
ncbi:Protein fam86a, partial [Physocladia obscura]